MAAMSLSSRDMRFSAAVKLPCESGEGRAGRALTLPACDEDELEVEVTVDVVDAIDGRGAVLDDADFDVEVEDDDVLRL